MTTGFTQAPAIDAAAFDSLIGAAVRGRTPTVVAPAPPPAPERAGAGGRLEGLRELSELPPVAPPAATAVATAVLPQAAPHGVTTTAPLPAAFLVDSTPDWATFARHVGRSVRTAAPLLGADVAALAVAGLAAEAVERWLLGGGGVPLGALAPVALLPVVVGYWLSGLYSEVWVHPAVEMRQSTQVTTLALLAATLTALVWAPPLALWCAAAWAVAVVAVPLLRAAARHCCAGRAGWGFPALVVGSGARADALVRVLMRSRTSGLRPVLVTDPEGVCRSTAVPVINDQVVLRSLVRAKGIRHAVLCLADLPAGEVSRAFDRYGSICSHLLVLCEAPPLPALWGAQRLCGLAGVEVRNGLMLAPLRVVKRVMDVVLSLAALVLGLPLLLAIALAVKSSSSGPVLYGHTRIGRYGRRFTAWKFRTMYRGADALLRQHLDRNPAARLEWQRDQKLRDDPRVTRVGRFLRRLSLDELPQMWNVLCGDMSVVGPRPIVDEEVAKYGESFELYAGVKPGITGLWQVSGRTDVGYEMRVRLDEFYVRHWSPWLDLYLLARTVVALLCRRGAY